VRWVRWVRWIWDRRRRRWDGRRQRSDIERYILYFSVNIPLRGVDLHFLHDCGVNLPVAVYFTPGLYPSAIRSRCSNRCFITRASLEDNSRITLAGVNGADAQLVLISCTTMERTQTSHCSTDP
jgi:hypothetical protein